MIFAKVFNKILEFYRLKKPSISVLSRRNRIDFSQTLKKKNRQKHMVFHIFQRLSAQKGAKTDGFLTIDVPRCTKTDVFLHILFDGWAHLSLKTLTFMLFHSFPKHAPRKKCKKPSVFLDFNETHVIIIVDC